MWFPSISRSSSRSSAKALVLSALLCCCGGARAQGHGNRAPRNVLTRPDAVDDKDALKDFHLALAVEATSEQVAEFHALLTANDAAKSQIQKLLSPSPAASNSQLDQTLESARTQSRKFTDGFSEKQKAGLKDQIRLLDRADAGLADQERKLDLAWQTPTIPAPERASELTTLDKALDDFSSQQMSLGREMGIVLANAEDVTFNLSAVRSTVRVASQPLEVTVSSLLSQTAADNGKRTFRLQMMGDLSDFQQNITEVLRGTLDSGNTCGERLRVRRATLMPSAPASNLHLQLHYERWACLRIAGQSTSTKIAESDGDAEIRLTPTVRESGVALDTDFGRIDASGMMGDSLRSGDLGHDLREKVAQAFLAAMQTATDLKAALPRVLEGSAALQSCRFEGDGAGDLAIMLQGQVQISEEQAKSLAKQLNQTFSADESGAK